MTVDALTANELRVHPLVVTAFAAAWADSFSDDPVLRHEEGGWICQNGVTGEVAIRRAPAGRRDEIDLATPVHLPGHFLVATYHTHPNPAALNFMPDPSPEDYYNGDVTRVPWFVIWDGGMAWTGPDKRRGGLTGDPGFPMEDDT